MIDWGTRFVDFLFGEMCIYSRRDFFIYFLSNKWWFFNGFNEKLKGEISSFLTRIFIYYQKILSLKFKSSFSTITCLNKKIQVDIKIQKPLVAYLCPYNDFNNPNVERKKSKYQSVMFLPPV